LNTWSPVSTNNLPEERYSASFVWTGSEMVVWGGYHFDPLQNGARYNPTSNTWQAMTNVGAPTAREYHTAIWTGGEMLIWGGLNGSTFYNDLNSYTTARTMFLYLKQ